MSSQRVVVRLHLTCDIANRSSHIEQDLMII